MGEVLKAAMSIEWPGALMIVGLAFAFAWWMRGHAPSEDSYEDWPAPADELEQEREQLREAEHRHRTNYDEMRGRINDLSAQRDALKQRVEELEKEKGK